MFMNYSFRSVFFLLLMDLRPGFGIAGAALPALCIGGMIALRPGARPGTGRLALFVSCAIGATVLLTAAGAVVLFVL